MNILPIIGSWGHLIDGLIDHLWQSTVFALAVALLTLAFRKNRAHVRYWMWLCASLKFLVPFAVLITLGSGAWSLLDARRAATPVVAQSVSIAIGDLTQPFSSSDSFPSSPLVASHSTNWLLLAAMALWVGGLVALALMRLDSWRHVRATLRASTPFVASGIAREARARVAVRVAPGLLEPGVVGIFRQTLLLPEGILQKFTPSQLESVLAHELAHVRRRDNLTATLHMLVEALFWFHPAVWWIGARLVEERERACDEAVLTLGNEPRDYAESILSVCKLYIESPIVCVSGVTGSNIKRRIERIVRSQIGAELTRRRKIILALVAVVALMLPILAGVVAMPSLRAQSAIGPVPKWDVISIKPCDAQSNLPPGMRGGGGGGGIPPATFSPVHMMLHCQTAVRFIQDAYLLFPNGQPPASLSFAFAQPVEGAPDWANTRRYTIEANAEANATPEMMEGPMLQALLEDRFKLKVHHETREVPVYDLVVAKGGPKLQPFDPASCTPFPTMPDIITGPPTPVPQLPPGQKYCSRWGGMIGPTAVNATIIDDGDTIADFCRDFLLSVGDDGRRAVDKTGIAGKYTIHLEYAPTEASRQARIARTGADPGDPTAPDIFTAIQEQLGLKLVPDKGPGDFLVIDHIEQPSAN